MVLNVIAYEFPKNLGSGLALCSTHLKEFVAKTALHSDAEPRILHHANSVVNGYTPANRIIHGTLTVH